MLVVEVAGELEGVLADLPIAETAVAPFGEVLGADGRPPELGAEDVLNLGERVEPREERFGLFAFGEADVNLLVEFGGEASDFPGAGHAFAGVERGRVVRRSVRSRRSDGFHNSWSLGFSS